MKNISGAEPLFIKQYEDLSPNFAKSQSREIGW